MSLYKSNWEGYGSAKFLGKEHVFRVQAGRGKRLSRRGLRNVTAKKFVNMRH